jgi:dCTP diphosphatase
MSKSIIKKINDFVTERDWNDLNDPSNTAKSICIEAAELLEKFQWKNYSAEEIIADANLREKIGREIADVLIYTYSLASMLELDEEKLVIDKLNDAALKYPVAQVKGKLGQKEYQKIKQEFRFKGKN